MNELNIQACILCGRIAKALLLAALTYYSLRTLDFTTTASISVALVPAILGTLNIITGFAYRLTAFIFVIASGVSIAHESSDKFTTKNFAEYIQLFSGLSIDITDAKNIKSPKSPSPNHTLTLGIKSQSSEAEQSK